MPNRGEDDEVGSDMSKKKDNAFIRLGYETWKWDKSLCNPYNMMPPHRHGDCEEPKPMMKIPMPPVITRVFDIGFVSVWIEVQCTAREHTKWHEIHIKEVNSGIGLVLTRDAYYRHKLEGLKMNTLYDVYMYCVGEDENGNPIYSDVSNTARFKTLIITVPDGTCETSVGGYNGTHWYLRGALYPDCVVCKE